MTGKGLLLTSWVIRINLWGVLISRHLSVKHFPSLRFHWRLFVAQKPPSGFYFHCRACCCICYVIIATSRQRDTVQLTNNCSMALINSGTLSHKVEEWPSSVGGLEGSRSSHIPPCHHSSDQRVKWSGATVDAGFTKPSLRCIRGPLNIWRSKLVPYPQSGWDDSYYWWKHPTEEAGQWNHESTLIVHSSSGGSCRIWGDSSAILGHSCSSSTGV